MALRFDIDGYTNAILNKLELELSYAFQNWKVEVENKMRNHEFKTNAYVDFEMKRNSNIIISYLKANTYVLADSYGTGSLMLTSNPGYQEYRNSNRWNRSRTSNAIMGRPEGKYTNVFGKERYSWGALEGHNIEGWKLTRGRFTLKVNPVSPSYAIQMADQWLYKTYLPRAYKNAIEQVSFTKYLIES